MRPDIGGMRDERRSCADDTRTFESGRTRNRNAVVPLPRSPAAIALARDNGRYSRDGLRCPGDRNSAHAPGYDRHPLLRSSRPRLGTAGISPSRLRATLRGQHRGGPRCRGCFPLDPRRISQHASQGAQRERARRGCKPKLECATIIESPSWATSFPSRALGVLVLLSLAAAFLLGMVAGVLTDSEFARASSTADGDDPYWHIDDVFAHRAAVPDAENSASVVMKASALLPKYFPPADEIETFKVLKMAQGSVMMMPDNNRLVEQFADGLRDELMNDAAYIEHRPYAERRGRWQQWRRRFDTQPETISFWAAVLPNKVFPGLFSAAQAALRFHAEAGATAILLAAERHRRKTGKWPETVAAIDPAILPKPPTDPFTGDAFHVERRNGELNVYSVGENLRDDHGELDKARRIAASRTTSPRGAWDVSLRRIPVLEPEPE